MWMIDDNDDMMRPMVKWQRMGMKDDNEFVYLPSDSNAKVN